MRVIPLVVVGLGAGCSSREPAPPAPPAQEAPTAMVDARPRLSPRELERRARRVVDDWATSQNLNNFPESKFPGYAALYAPGFTGVRRSGAQAVHLDRDGWLRERRRMFANQMSVKVYRAHVTLLTDERARVRFLQDWRSGSYRDIGDKEIDVDRDGHIVREELLTSRRLAACDLNDCASDPAAACREACDAGALHDCASLGWIHREGRCGAAVDVVAAAAAFARACEVTDLACVAAAELADPDDDPSITRGMLERGCETASGSAGFAACMELGERLLTGDDGGPKDVRRAIELFETVCGFYCLAPIGPQGCEALAEIYRTGTGVPKDRARARAYDQRAEQECTAE